MKADDGRSNARLDQVDSAKTTLKVSAAPLVGAAISLGFLAYVLGIRPDLQDGDIMFFVLARLLFGLSVVALSTVFLDRLSRAGSGFRSTLAFTALPFFGVMVLAVVGMAADPNWVEMVTGDQWRSCALAVPIITIVPFVVIMGAVRLAAPVNPTQAGAVAGLAASAVSVITFTLHCTVDPAPLVALWFGGTGILCMISGASLGPRLLRS